MKRFLQAILGMAILPMCLYAQETNDSTAWWKQEQNLQEVVVVGQRTVLKQSPDRIVYLTRNDIYAKGLNGIEVLDRIPRVSVVNDLVTVAGKSSVRYIVDGRLLEMSDEAIALQLKNLQASGIEKIELLTTPPAKYAAGTNVAYISITTRNETLGTRGNVWGRGIIKEDFSNQLGGNISHTTRKVELSADASWTDTKGINDLDRTYTFADHIKTSNRRTDFTNRQFGINGLFKYKFSDRLSAGAIVNAQCKVVMITFPPIIDEQHAWRNLIPGGKLDDQLQSQRQIVRDFAAENRWPLLDLYKLMWDRRYELILPDGVHLNPAGQVFFSEAVYQLIKQEGWLEQ